MRSAWRGEARKTSMPKRERSYREVPAAIISMAQQASPKVAGHMEALRAHPANSSTVLSRKPDDWSLICVSPRVLVRSVPLEATAPPLVHERHGDQREEGQHRDEPEGRQGAEVHRPRVEEDDLD